MTGSDYAGLLETASAQDLRGQAFTLRLGPWEIASVPFATVLTLGQEPVAVREILGRCFVSRPVLWSDLESERSQHCLQALHDLSSLLAEEEHQLGAAPRSSDLIYREIVRRWREATADAAEQLEELVESRRGSAREREMRAVLARYRQRAYGAVSALLQFLPTDDEWTVDARRRYTSATNALARASGVSPDELKEAAWYPAEELEGESDVPPTVGGSVTWGIP